MLYFFKTFTIPLIILVMILDMVFFRFIPNLFNSNILGIAIYIITFLIALEYYSILAFRSLNHSTSGLVFYILIHCIIYGGILYMSFLSKGGGSTAPVKISMVILSLMIIPKLFIGIIFIIDDLIKIISYGRNIINGNEPILSSRRKALTWIGLGIASIPLLAVLDGIFFGKYRYRVICKQIFFDDLPQEFDGFTITQLSDIHSGSFDYIEKVKYGISLAKKQNSDILVFTGDIVNSKSDELEPYINVFSVLSAPEGMFSVLGNHDYGIHGNLSREERKKSIERILEIQKEIGFTPLLNERRTIIRNGKKLNIIGVENWGHSDFFPKKGDLSKATQDVNEKDFNILLSHDPSFFDHQLENYDNIVNFKKKIHLTLSGHTHGMQFGIEIPGLIKWSPVKYRYHNWAGLYEQNDRKLYVNRGFGFLAFPGRVGEWPEITVLELKRKST